MKTRAYSLVLDIFQYVPEEVTEEFPYALLVFLVHGGVDAARADHFRPTHGILQLHVFLLKSTNTDTGQIKPQSTADTVHTIY